MDDRTSPVGLIAIVGIAAASTIGLHILGGVEGLTVDWADPAVWANRSSAEDVISASLRLVGLGIGYWVLATTGLYVVTGLGKPTHRPRWISVMTLPGIRRVIDRTLATALAASIAATPFSPALAAEPRPAPAVVFDVSDGIPVPHVRSTSQPAATEAPGATTPDQPGVMPTIPNLAPLPVPTIPTTTAAISTARTVPGSTHTVAAGDNLWLIATNHVATAHDGTASAADVADYWRRVIASNQYTLRSGDPNLIFPGELITLPAIEVGP